jgi:hypothetical protein
MEGYRQKPRDDVQLEMSGGQDIHGLVGASRILEIVKRKSLMEVEHKARLGLGKHVAMKNWIFTEW